jgi:hypothetical protein
MAYKICEDWLFAAVHQFRLLFKRHGYDMPDSVKVTCGWPGGKSKNRDRIAEG